VPATDGKVWLPRLGLSLRLVGQILDGRDRPAQKLSRSSNWESQWVAFCAQLVGTRQPL